MKRIVWNLFLLACSCLTVHGQYFMHEAGHGYAKRMVRVFRYINEGKIEKSVKERTEIEKKYAKDKSIDKNRYPTIGDFLQPIWQLSDCLAKNTKEIDGFLYANYSPWEAYTMLKSSVYDYHLTDEANNFLSHKDIRMSIAMIKQNIETNLIDEVRVLGREERYDVLIESLFDYPEINELIAERESVAYSAISRSGDLSECKRYLQKYTDANDFHREQITMLRDSLAFVEMDTTSSACIQYVSEYPDSRFVPKVKELQARYDFYALDHTVAACDNYIRKYRSSPYIKDVRKLRERYAFEEARRSDTIEDYERFCSNYNQSEYLDEIRQCLDQRIRQTYIHGSVTMKELRDFCERHSDWSGRTSADSLMHAFYNNLLFMPTSLLLKDCNGLQGTVKIVTKGNNIDYTETLHFNNQGLMDYYQNSRTGITNTYSYDFDEQTGFRLVSMADSKGAFVKYTTKFDKTGLILEIAGSDGTTMSYTYSGDDLQSITYKNGNNFVRTDYYDMMNQRTKSERKDVTVIYEYNRQGDTISMQKKIGSTIMETTTYEYEYDKSGNVWTTMRQYNDGECIFSKYRATQ